MEDLRVPREDRMLRLVNRMLRLEEEPLAMSIPYSRPPWPPRVPVESFTLTNFIQNLSRSAPREILQVPRNDPIQSRILPPILNPRILQLNQPQEETENREERPAVVRTPSPIFQQQEEPVSSQSVVDTGQDQHTEGALLSAPMEDLRVPREDLMRFFVDLHKDLDVSPFEIYRRNRQNDERYMRLYGYGAIIFDMLKSLLQDSEHSLNYLQIGSTDALWRRIANSELGDNRPQTLRSPVAGMVEMVQEGSVLRIPHGVLHNLLVAQHREIMDWEGYTGTELPQRGSSLEAIGDYIAKYLGRAERFQTIQSWIRDHTLTLTYLHSESLEKLWGWQYAINSLSETGQVLLKTKGFKTQEDLRKAQNRIQMSIKFLDAEVFSLVENQWLQYFSQTETEKFPDILTHSVTFLEGLSKDWSTRAVVHPGGNGRAFEYVNFCWDARVVEIMKNTFRSIEDFHSLRKDTEKKEYALATLQAWDREMEDALQAERANPLMSDSKISLESLWMQTFRYLSIFKGLSAENQRVLSSNVGFLGVREGNALRDPLWNPVSDLIAYHLSIGQILEESSIKDDHNAGDPTRVLRYFFSHTPLMNTIHAYYEEHGKKYNIKQVGAAAFTQIDPTSAPSVDERSKEAVEFAVGLVYSLREKLLSSSENQDGIYFDLTETKLSTFATEDNLFLPLLNLGHSRSLRSSMMGSFRVVWSPSNRLGSWIMTDRLQKEKEDRVRRDIPIPLESVEPRPVKVAPFPFGV